MQRAIELSREKMRAGAGGPFGATIVREGEIIAEGWNRVTSDNDPTAHAEMVAIREACRRLGTFDLSGCEIHTSCEPCPMCLAAIYWARIDAVHYANTREDAAAIGFDDSLIYDEVAAPLQARRIPMRRSGEGPAFAVFREWASMEGKTPY